MGRPLVFATVGTDHHRFDRLVAWVDAWLAAGAAQRVDCVVQHGTSQPSAIARSEPYLAFQEMQRHFREASVVVCHGGPSTIMDAKTAGLVPIALPRRPELGEHVDDHQVRFVSRLADLGEVWTASDQAGFAERLEAALTAPPVSQRGEQQIRVERAITRFETLVDGLFERPGRRTLTRTR